MGKHSINMGCGASAEPAAPAEGDKQPDAAPDAAGSNSNTAADGKSDAGGASPGPEAPKKEPIRRDDEEETYKKNAAAKVADYESRVEDVEYDPQSGEHSALIKEGRALIEELSKTTFQRISLADEISKIEDTIAKHKKERGKEHLEDMKNRGHVVGHFAAEGQKLMKQADEVADECIVVEEEAPAAEEAAPAAKEAAPAAEEAAPAAES